MEISANRKKIAYAVAPALGLQPSVRPYLDRDEAYAIDMLTLTDPIDPSVRFYCTIGISDSPNLIELKDGSFQDIPVELLMTGYENFDLVPNILSTCAFYMIKDGWECQPGTVFKSMVAMYYPHTAMKHVLFLPPFLWEDKLKPVELTEDKTVNFLLAVPISDEELKYREQYGRDALEDVFEEKQIDIFDINRPSAL